MGGSVKDLFRRRMREVREQAGMSQVELARRMAAQMGSRVDPPTITRMENGERAVRIQEAVAAAAALEVPLDELLRLGGTNAEARIATVRFSLERAENELAVMEGEVERKREYLSALQEELDELEDQADREHSDRINAEHAADLKVAQWPV